MAEATRPEKIELLREIDAEIGRLQNKRMNNTLMQLVGVVVIFAAQLINIYFWPTPTGNEDVDFCIKWSWPVWMLVWGAIIIWRGSRISKQIRDKIDEFFMELQT
jgi:hypothetical protein